VEKRRVSATALGLGRLPDERPAPEYVAELGPEQGRIRVAVLARDGYRCRACGSNRDLVVHLRPEFQARYQWWLIEEDDCLTSCASCHSRAKRRRR
jgi:predicted nucleic acid-binding Zn ribbon protein